MKPRLLLWAGVVTCMLEVAFTPQHIRTLQSRALALFKHGWNAYLEHGFPADEVRPITCEPYGPDYGDPDNLRNDVMGNVLLTLLDNLDTLLVMDQAEELDSALQYLKQNQHTFFAQDTVVQVFEASIRWLGGLLSAHLLLTDVNWSHNAEMLRISQQYDGFLLTMAYDLGLRLIPAYRTATHLPVPRINLLNGLDAVPDRLNSETCTSGATTPIVEMLLLLRLTGDPQFEAQTRRTFWKLWTSRLALGLMPMTLDPLGNQWLDKVTGIGALMDSFYEYALKGAILFDDPRLWSVFSRSYRSLLTHLAQTAGGPDAPTYFANVDIETGGVTSPWIDSLAAFWAGVQVLAGRLTDAVSSHLVYLKVWNTFDLLPERWTFQRGGGRFVSVQDKLANAVPLEWYPLRPEFIESTYYLYRATRDPMYLQIGVRILKLYETRFKSVCGFAGIQDLRTGQRQNRMETFVLGELLKYLYLLFDEANSSFVHKPGMKHRNWVFSTEAHPLWYSDKLGRRSTAEFHRNLRNMPVQPELAGRSGLNSLWHRLRRARTDLHDESEQEDPELFPILPMGLVLAPTQAELETCEVWPRQFRKNTEFSASAYYSWDKLFWPDLQFESTLVRPPYLEDFSETTRNNSVEISQPFFKTYSVPFRALTCPRFPTTTEQEYVFGKLGRPENVEMFRVQRPENTLELRKGDIVVPLMGGRVRMEVLKPGTVDSTNLRISREYIRRKHPEKWISRSAEVLRVNSVNGVAVGKARTLWTDRRLVERNSDIFRLAKNDNVYFQGRYVENMRVY